MGKRIHQVIIGGEVMLLCMVVALLSTQAASANPPSNGVSYNKNGQVTVENALDNLYSKVNYGDAKANEILKGKKALVGGKEVVGTFTCPTLASLTPGDATAEDIIKGKIAWVNGNKVVGTYTSPTSSISNPSIALVEKVELGDYISYTPSKTSYTISKEDTGGTLDYNLNPSELNVWRVIRENEDGTLEIISNYVSSINFWLTPDCDYKSLLTKIAQQYETNGITLGSRYIDGGDCMPFEKSIIEDLGLIKMALGTLAAKKVGSDENFSYWISAERLCGISDESYSGGSGEVIGAYNRILYVRPIVILKSGLKITGGVGTEGSPYTLGT